MQAWPMTSKRRNAPALASAPCEGGGGARADFRVAARPLPAVECLNPRGGRATRACPVTLRLPGARAEVSVGRADGGGRAVASRCGKKGERSFGCAVLLRHPGPSGRAGLGTRGAAPPSGCRATSRGDRGVVGWGRVAAWLRDPAGGSLVGGRAGRAAAARFSASSAECGCLRPTDRLRSSRVCCAVWCEAVKSPRREGRAFSRTRFFCQVDEGGQV